METYLARSMPPRCLRCLKPFPFYIEHTNAAAGHTPWPVCEFVKMNGGDDKGNSISGRLSSLWNTSTDKDDTCVTWGLVGGRVAPYCVVLV